MKRWRVWNMDYRPTDKSCRRLIRQADLEKPWIVERGLYGRGLYSTQFFATHAEALEYALQQTGKSAT